MPALRVTTLSLLLACAARGWTAPRAGVVQQLQEQVEDSFYQPDEAVALMKKLATAKFTETAELHGNLNLDPKYNDQQIRTTVSLPHGTGNDVRVAVLADGPAADAAKEAGADIVGFEDLIETISTGVTDFDVLI